MKLIGWVSILLLSLVSVSCNSDNDNGDVKPIPKPIDNLGQLQIHFVNVQQGMSVLIVGPTGISVLYDGGDAGKGTADVVPYLKSKNIPNTIDYIIISHRDTDHYKGLTEVLASEYDVRHIYDNGSSKSYSSDFTTEVSKSLANQILPITLGYQIDLGSGAKITVVAVNGSVSGAGIIPGSQNNENDRSVCLLVQWGSFDCLLTADAGGGDESCTDHSTSQVDIETPLVMSVMPGGVNPLLPSSGVEVVQVGHHGSESSSNSYWMNHLAPLVACIPVGSGQGSNWFHPRKSVVDNVLLRGVNCITASAAFVLQTDEGLPAGAKTSYSGYCVGDIVILTNGTSNFQLSGSGRISQGNDERAAAGLPRSMNLK